MPNTPPSGSRKGMSDHRQANNPLHGVTLEMILTRLVAHYGWQELGAMINIKCFNREGGAFVFAHAVARWLRHGGTAYCEASGLSLRWR